jgi:hypothetical protein
MQSGAIPGAPGLVMGLIASTASVNNDSSHLNLSVNGASTVLAGMSTFGTGTVAAVGTGGGLGVAGGAMVWSASNWISDHVIIPVFSPDANQSDTIDADGYTIPNPQAGDWQQNWPKQ